MSSTDNFQIRYKNSEAIEGNLIESTEYSNLCKKGHGYVLTDESCKFLNLQINSPYSDHQTWELFSCRQLWGLLRRSHWGDSRASLYKFHLFINDGWACSVPSIHSCRSRSIWRNISSPTRIDDRDVLDQPEAIREKINKIPAIREVKSWWAPRIQ